MHPSNPDQRPGRDGQQYVFHGCTVLVCDDEAENCKVIFVILGEGLLAFAAPMEAMVARALSPNEVEAYFRTMPPSPAADELRDLWKKSREQTSA